MGRIREDVLVMKFRVDMVSTLFVLQKVDLISHKESSQDGTWFVL